MIRKGRNGLVEFVLDRLCDLKEIADRQGDPRSLCEAIDGLIADLYILSRKGD